MASAKDLIQVEWKEGKTPLQESVSGDIVWSSTYQKGIMRLVGLPINDPLQEQYPLWIIDPLRDKEPVVAPPRPHKQFTAFNRFITA